MSIAIFGKKDGMKIETVAEGTLLADGSEQTVIEDGTGPAILSGFICLTELQGGDSVLIKAYVLINGTYGLYGQDTYTGIQPEPILRINAIRYKDKLKITLQQTVGLYRTFGYEFVREV